MSRVEVLVRAAEFFLVFARVAFATPGSASRMWLLVTVLPILENVGWQDRTGEVCVKGKG